MTSRVLLFFFFSPWNYKAMQKAPLKVQDGCSLFRFVANTKLLDTVSMLQDRMAIQRGPGKAKMAKQTQLQAVPSWVPALLRQGKLLVSRKVKLGTAAQAANQLCTAAAACAPAQDDPGFLFTQHLLICIWILCPERPSVHKGFENTECVQRRVSKMVRH